MTISAQFIVFVFILRIKFKRPSHCVKMPNVYLLRLVDQTIELEKTLHEHRSVRYYFKRYFNHLFVCNVVKKNSDGQNNNSFVCNVVSNYSDGQNDKTVLLMLRKGGQLFLVKQIAHEIPVFSFYRLLLIYI